MSHWLYSQPMDCSTCQSQDSNIATRTIMLAGVIDKVHPYRMFLCVQGDAVRGLYEMRSTARTIDLEGFVKGDSIFLGEYSRSQHLLGTVKGLLANGQWEGTLFHPDGKYAGNIQGIQAITWVQAGVLSKNLADSLSATSGKIVFYRASENARATKLLLTYPNDYSCRGILNHPNEMPYFFSGKKPTRSGTKYVSSKHNKSNEKNNVQLTNRAAQLAMMDQVTSPDTLLLAPHTIIPLHVRALSDRLVSYEIHYPVLDDPAAHQFINHLVNEIKKDFDSIRLEIRQQYNYEDYHSPTRLIAWFEPSLYSKHWLCGHFIINCSERDISEILPVNYSFVWNKNIDLEHLIRHEAPLEWNELIEGEKALDSKGQPSTLQWSDPVLTFGSLLLTTPFDRVYDRKLYQLAPNQDRLRWKWWKPVYWWIKMNKS